MESPRGAEFLETLPDLVARLGVEAGRRFVEDEELRPVEQGAGHDEPPDHPAGEIRRWAFPAVVQGHEFQKLPGLRGGLRRGMSK